MLNHKILLTLLLFFLTSCGFSNKAALKLYKKEIPNDISSLELLKKYGPAQQAWHDDFNYNNIFSYSYSKPRYDFLSFLPIPNFQSKFDNYEVVLTFDANGNLADVKKFHDRIKTKSWLICEAAIADCDLGREIVSRKY